MFSNLLPFLHIGAPDVRCGMLTQRARFCGEAALGPARTGHLAPAAAARARREARA